MDLVLRNLGENRLRTTLTIAGIAVCVILFIFFNSVGKGLNDYIEARAAETNISRYYEIAQILDSWLYIINTILIIVLTVAVANTMLIAVSERQRILATLKAVGFSNSQLRTLVLMEALVLSSLAFLIGSVVGVSAALISDFLFWQANPSGQELFLFLAPAELSTMTIIGAAVLSIVAGTLAALYPAVMASKMNPVEALRYE